ncbi:MAG TPA: long-chain fatty acid--CoA ligase [Gammaproteobacteria bacterium]|nr:long-chain fatty acid--CoA ligase [Gammaproteobacteria bacterium]
MTDIIAPDQAKTLSELFRERVGKMPDKIAYRQYDATREQWVATSWREMAGEVARWQAALRSSGLVKGDRAAVMLRNCREWVLFDQAALGLGLITVPLYIEDRAENAAFILRNAEVKFLLVEGAEQWRALLCCEDGLPTVRHIVSLQEIQGATDPRLRELKRWLPETTPALHTEPMSPDELASIVYTSGTTGKPKGVMLTHRNILHNAWSSARTVDIDSGAEFLSFLPLSHTLERTIGYYLAMMVGGTVTYNRSIKLLPDDLVAIRPSVLISVPRIYERVYAKVSEALKSQPRLRRLLFEATLHVGWKRFKWRQREMAWSPWLLLWPLLDRLVARKIMSRLGGRVRFAICGGAPLPSGVSRFFISLGLNLLQGYGLTEASPVISVNRERRNRPDGIGLPLPDIEVRIAANGELETRSPCVMRGYWQDEAATRLAFTTDGWLRTGDKARMDEDGFLYITGRLKEIIVLSNGEKVPPADMEMAISMDPLIEQVMVVGEARPYLTALVVLNPDVWRVLARERGVDPNDTASLRQQKILSELLHVISSRLKEFPGYAQVRKVFPTLQPWTVEDGMLTPTLKLKRNSLLEKYASEIAGLYKD